MIAALAPTHTVVRGNDAAILDVIGERQCALAIHDRRCPPAISAAIAALDLDTIDDIDAVIPVDDAATHVAVLLGAAGYPVATAAELTRDIAPLVVHHATLHGGDAAALRLEVVETDACRRFHADKVTTRMIITYRGAGTQWIMAETPEVVQQVPTGAVAIFKGRLLAQDAPVLHRSPPIATAAGPRLLLVIDPA